MQAKVQQPGAVVLQANNTPPNAEAWSSQAEQVPFLHEVRMASSAAGL